MSTMIHSAFRYASGARVYALNAVKRHLATISEQQPSPPLNPKPTVPPVPSKMTKTGALRPHMGITVRPDHGLYHFFRKVPKEDSPLGYEYLPYEPMDESVLGASRSWTTAELRRKCFRDLHILWYMVRREINLLATQRAEIRRIHRDMTYGSTPISLRARMCRKTCARIKFVLNERRLALLNATARVQWGHRPGYKDPAKNPKKKLTRGKQMTEKEMNQRIRRLASKTKLKHLHPQLRKRRVLMLKWAPRHGLARPITPPSDYPVVKTDD